MPSWNAHVGSTCVELKEGNVDVPELLDARRAVDLRRVLDLRRDRGAARDEDHDREGKDPPRVDDRDREQGEVGTPEPLQRNLGALLDVRGAEEPEDRAVQMEPVECPVDDAVERVEDPQPGDRREHDGRGPGQDHQEADEPLAAKVANEKRREHRGADHDQDLRGDREEEGVAKRAPEVVVAPGAREVVEADPLAAE
jgi:hypothetical protein